MSYELDEIPGDLLAEYPSKDTRYLTYRLYYIFDGMFQIKDYALSEIDGKWHVGICFTVSREWIEAVQKIALNRFPKETCR